MRRSKVLEERRRRVSPEALRMAEALKNNPMRFVVTNVITMDVEITKSDLKTIVYHRPKHLRCRDTKPEKIKTAELICYPDYGATLSFQREESVSFQFAKIGIFL